MSAPTRRRSDAAASLTHRLGEPAPPGGGMNRNGMAGRKRPTIREVAQLAGVSIGTVSNVINDNGSVRAKTRSQVNEAINVLGYTPNTIARSLIARRSRLPEREAGPPRPQLTTVGYLSVDYTARVDRLPARGARMTAASGIRKSLGGPAANVAVMAAGLGPPFAVQSELITSLGDDADSDWALAELAERHVETIGIRGSGERRLSRCMVLVEPDGRRTIVNEPFVLEVDSVLPYIVAEPSDRPHYVHFDGYQVATMASSVDALAEQGLVTSVHTTGLHADWRNADGFRRLCRTFDVVFLNRDLGQAIVGSAVPEPELIAHLDGLIAAVRSDVRSPLVLLTLDADGAVAIDGRGAPVTARAPSVPVVDATGAGDTFAGVFLAVRMNARPVAEALQLATAAASRSVTVESAQGLRPSAADLLADFDAAPGATDVAPEIAAARGTSLGTVAVGG